MWNIAQKQLRYQHQNMVGGNLKGEREHFSGQKKWNMLAKRAKMCYFLPFLCWNHQIWSKFNIIIWNYFGANWRAENILEEQMPPHYAPVVPPLLKNISFLSSSNKYTLWMLCQKWTKQVTYTIYNRDIHYIFAREFHLGSVVVHFLAIYAVVFWPCKASPE